MAKLDRYEFLATASFTQEDIAGLARRNETLKGLAKKSRREGIAKCAAKEACKLSVRVSNDDRIAQVGCQLVRNSEGMYEHCPSRFIPAEVAESMVSTAQLDSLTLSSGIAVASEGVVE
jgi:hypothetical protein